MMAVDSSLEPMVVLRFLQRCRRSVNSSSNFRISSVIIERMTELVSSVDSCFF